MARVGSGYSKHGGTAYYDRDSALDSWWKEAPNPRLCPAHVGFGSYDDFLVFPVDDTTGDPLEWKETIVETGLGGDSTCSQVDLAGGAILLQSDNADNDGYQIQLLGESFNISATNYLWFDCKIKLTEATQMDAFVGLSATTGTVIATPGAVYIGFAKDDGDTNWDFVSNDTGESEIVGVATAAAGAWVVLGFYWDGPNLTLTPYVDGVAGTVIDTAANLPTGAGDNMQLSFAMLTGDTAVEGMYVDWYRIVQTR